MESRRNGPQLSIRHDDDDDDEYHSPHTSLHSPGMSSSHST